MMGGTKHGHLTDVGGVGLMNETRCGKCKISGSHDEDLRAKTLTKAKYFESENDM